MTNEPADLAARAWLVGFGNRLVPRAPFEVARLPGGQRVVFAHHGQAGVRQLMVAPDPASTDSTTTKMAFGRDTRSVDEVLAFVEPDEFEPAWQVYTREVCCRMPDAATVWSTPYQASWPFELTIGKGPRDEMIHVQGPWAPHQAPELDRLVAEGMRRVDRGAFPGPAGRCDWITVQYEHAGQVWLQRRCLVPLGREAVVLVTAQARPETAPVTFAAADEMSRTLISRR
jgi:hypothetical protein